MSKLIPIDTVGAQKLDMVDHQGRDFGFLSLPVFRGNCSLWEKENTPEALLAL